MPQAGLRDVIRRATRAHPVAILALAWLALVIYAFPGQLTADSYEHLREVREGVWTDSHPPAMVLLWRVADAFVAGPAAMLAIQATLVVAGLYLVFRRAFEPGHAAWAATGVLLFPPVFAVLPVVWKDAPMTGLLLIGAALVHDERRRRRILGLAALGAATALRYNAFAATFPLIVLVFEWEPGMTWLKRYGIAVVAWLATSAAAFGLNAALTDRKMYGWHSTLALFDIVGTLAHVDGDLPDAELEELLAGTELRVHHDIHAAIRRAYHPDEFISIVLVDHQPNLWEVPLTGADPLPEAQRDAIARAYSATILGHLGAYLAHRAAVMGEVLWLHHPFPAGAIRSRALVIPDAHPQLGLSTGWSQVQMTATKWLTTIWKKSPLFLPWVYALLALVLVPLARRHRDLIALLLSGLALELSLFVLAASPDYRYSHWMITTVCIVAIMLTARRARGMGLTDR